MLCLKSGRLNLKDRLKGVNLVVVCFVSK